MLEMRYPKPRIEGTLELRATDDGFAVFFSPKRKENHMAQSSQYPLPRKEHLVIAFTAEYVHDAVKAGALVK